MKRVILFILFFFVVCCVLGAPVKWVEPDNWAKLEKRMTSVQVGQLLSNPIKRDTSTVGAIWYYQEVPRVEGTRIIRPDHGLVKFRMVNRVLVVVEWVEPDWDKLSEELAKQEEVSIEPEGQPEEEGVTEGTNEEALEQTKSTTKPFSRRPERDYSEEALEKQREAARIAAEKALAERRDRREKLAAEYAEMEKDPVEKKRSLAHPFFLLGGLLFLAGAVTFIVYSRFCKPD